MRRKILCCVLRQSPIDNISIDLVAYIHDIVIFTQGGKSETPILREYHGITMGAQWEDKGNTTEIQWEYKGVPWEYMRST